MLRARTTNTFVLPEGTILAAAEGDMRGWGLNLVALPKETLYQLQDGVTVELCAREGRALQVLSEQKLNLEQLSLQHDNLVAQTQGLEQAMEEAYSSIPELAVPAALSPAEKIHQLAAGVRKV